MQFVEDQNAADNLLGNVGQLLLVAALANGLNALHVGLLKLLAISLVFCSP